LWQTLLSVLTVFSGILLILMIRDPARTSRLKVISIPRVFALAACKQTDIQTAPAA
jgi:hypothetical protein